MMSFLVRVRRGKDRERSRLCEDGGRDLSNGGTSQEEAGRGKKGPSPRASGGSTDLMTP